MKIFAKTRNILRNKLRATGYDIVRYQQTPIDVEKSVAETIREVRPYTLTSVHRLVALCEAVQYVVCNQIPGDIVECGVWKGGSMMAVARTLIQASDQNRHLYLFDTYEGMTSPSDRDISVQGELALDLLGQEDKTDANSVWCVSSLDEVRRAVGNVGYDPSKVHFVKGRVEETLPMMAPERISLLRLDTDWYESTRHEMEHLFPRLAKGGVLIVDDYGYWQGARRAVDEYIEENRLQILLHRIDETGRCAVKLL
jgi:O-methyltransferase